MQVIYSQEGERLGVREDEVGFSLMRYLRFYAETLCMPNACPSLLALIPCAVNEKMI